MQKGLKEEEIDEILEGVSPIILSSIENDLH